MPDQYSRYEYQHVSDDSPERRQFKKIFGEQIQRSKYLYQIEQYFKPDYELIEKVEFYGTR
jgi:hypothetical protein